MSVVERLKKRVSWQETENTRVGRADSEDRPIGETATVTTKGDICIVTIAYRAKYRGLRDCQLKAQQGKCAFLPTAGSNNCLTTPKSRY